MFVSFAHVHTTAELTNMCGMGDERVLGPEKF